MDTSPNMTTNKILSPLKRDPLQGPDLNGLVNVKPYERAYTNEVPAVSCHLLPSQIDFLKVLVCEEDCERQSKLTQDASDKLEIEKQT